ncbi:uncharacterized protein LOC144153648 [Haemaphysalis longicornis]
MLLHPLCFAVVASLLAESRGQVVPDNCPGQDECYQAAVEEAFNQISTHEELGPLCEALRNETGFLNCASAYGTGTCESDPWAGLADAFVGSLCTEENLRTFRTPPLGTGQCFHFNYSLECATQSPQLAQYGGLARFLRSPRNHTVCKTVSEELRRCAIGVSEGCILKDAIQAALARVAGSLLHAVGCQQDEGGQGTPHGNHTTAGPAVPDSADCETRMTRVTACLRDILSPNTVAKELLGHVRTQHMDYDETFCRTYENVLECKRKFLTSDCFTRKSREMLSRNLEAFAKAGTWLCSDERQKLREFTASFNGDGCDPDDDVISQCSEIFVHNVSQSGFAASPAITNRMFMTQLKCIETEFQGCKAGGSARNVVDGYLNVARAAFLTQTADGLSVSANLVLLLLMPLLGFSSERLVCQGA